jgi:hypothetical protein
MFSALLLWNGDFRILTLIATSITHSIKVRTAIVLDSLILIKIATSFSINWVWGGGGGGKCSLTYQAVFPFGRYCKIEI